MFRLDDADPLALLHRHIQYAFLNGKSEGTVGKERAFGFFSRGHERRQSPIARKRRSAWVWLSHLWV